MVQAMYDSIYAGATIEARIGDVTRRFSSEHKRFIRQISRDGVYAEATLLAKDDDQESWPIPSQMHLWPCFGLCL